MTGVRDPVARGDRGAAALATTMATCGVVAVLLVAGLPALGVVLAVQRAAATADLVALAVLGGSSLAGGDGDPAVPAGRAVAAANGAQLRAVDTAGWPLGVHVEVALPLDIPLVRADATAVGTAQLRRPPSEAAAPPALLTAPAAPASPP